MQTWNLLETRAISISFLPSFMFLSHILKRFLFCYERKSTDWEPKDLGSSSGPTCVSTVGLSFLIYEVR